MLNFILNIIHEIRYYFWNRNLRDCWIKYETYFGETNILIERYPKKFSKTDIYDVLGRRALRSNASGTKDYCDQIKSYQIIHWREKD